MTKNENCLLFDTSNGWLLVAIANPSRIISRCLDLPRRTFQLLPGLIQELCQEIEIEKPQWIVTTVGPGSYTGIRLGVGFARNLAQLWRIPVMGIASLPFYCYCLLRKGAMEDAKGLAIMIDGKQGRAYSMSLELATDSLKENMVKLMPGRYQLLDQAVDVFLSSIPESHSIFADHPQSLSSYVLPQNSSWCIDRVKNAVKLPSPKGEYFYELAMQYGGLSKAGAWFEIKPLYLRESVAKQTL